MTVITLLLSIAAAYVVGQSNQLDQGKLADSVLHGTDLERGGAIERAKHIAPTERSEILERALAGELERLNSLYGQRRAAQVAGRSWNRGGTEHYGDLIEAVSKSTNPIVLPALVGALGTGNLAAEGVARFGEPAVPQVADLLRTSDAPEQISGGLRAFTLMLRGNGGDRSSDYAKATIMDIAHEMLSGKRHPVVLAAAADLAVATREQDLVASVRSLARDPRAVAAFGIEDPSLVAMVRRRAAEALRRVRTGG